MTEPHATAPGNQPAVTRQHGLALLREMVRIRMSLVTFANSITLTPGTITILIRDGYYFVHAVDMKVAGDLPGEMEERVGHIFMEGEDG